MSRQLLFAAIFMLSINAIAQQKINHTISVIPQPVNLTAEKGNFAMDAKTSIQYSSSNKDLQTEAKFLVNAVNDISGISLSENKSFKKQIKLLIQKIDGIGNEGYVLNITPTSITIKANTKAGIFYGIQTLLQVIPNDSGKTTFNVPCLNIKDYPRFSWRGMHLDVSRHFFSADFIKEYIDLISKYKMNTFHWHLVDDQGWRIEIKKYPNLTQTGAWRVDHSDVAWASSPRAKPGEAATYGGYYTQEQIKEIVQYATERNVNIVPEIEMPGHSAAAIASYPWLSCTQAPQLPLTGGHYENIASNYCAGNDSVFTFLEDVLNEVMDLFSSKYIHVGGDEVDKTPWKNCARCQARIKAEGLKNEEELQSYFMKRIEKFIISKNRKMIGWDEILEGGLAPEATVMSWRGESGGIAAAKMNHDVVMTPGVPCYFDHYQTGPEGEPVAIGGMNTLKRVYDYEPVPKELNVQEAKYVMGAQANVWSEFIPTKEHAEYMVLPRMLALAEVLWTPASAKSWNSFYERLQPSFKYFEHKGYNYSRGNFNIDIKPFTEDKTLKIALSSEIATGDIHYTFDGSEPTIHSPKYTAPILITSSVQLKAAVALNGVILNKIPSTQSFVTHKALGADIIYTNANSKSYPAEGAYTLTDGIRGTLAASQNWHGFNGKDLIATIDLGGTKNVHTITIGCLQRYFDWIFMPQYVKFETSTDGVNFVEAGTINNTVSPDEKNPVMKDFSVAFNPQDARYVRVTAKVADCPKGHPAEGKPAWIFADEIIVE